MEAAQTGILRQARYRLFAPSPQITTEKPDASGQPLSVGCVP